MRIVIVLILTLLSCSTEISSQVIESLSSNKQVSRFLTKYISNDYTFKEVFDRERELDEDDFNEYVMKCDLDQNGFTDLIVDGYSNFIFVLNYGNKNFKEVKFEDNLRLDLTPQLDTIIKNQSQPIIVFKTEITEFERDQYLDMIVKKNKKVFEKDDKTGELKWISKEVEYKIDSLIIKHAKFLTYREITLDKPLISEIYFETSGCLGNCPIFQLKIDSSGTVNFNGIKHTRTAGTKVFKLEINQFIMISDLIHYSDLLRLEDSYTVNWTDDQTSKLKVVFRDGRSKEITDYGLQGTINLKSIYQELQKIANN